jgi:hypothetical protein
MDSFCIDLQCIFTWQNGLVLYRFTVYFYLAKWTCFMLSLGTNPREAETTKPDKICKSVLRSAASFYSSPVSAPSKMFHAAPAPARLKILFIVL